MIAALFQEYDAEQAWKLLDHLNSAKPASNVNVSKWLAHYLLSELELCTPVDSRSRLLSNSWKSHRDTTESNHATVILTKLTSLMNVFVAFSPFLYRHPVLLSRVCRLCKILAVYAALESYNLIDKMIRLVLLPSFSLFPSNFGLTVDLWSLLKQFNYVQRFSWFRFWKEDVYSMTPEVYLSFQRFLDYSMLSTATCSSSSLEKSICHLRS